MITTVGSTLYQHSLDRTRETVKKRIKLPSGRTVEVTRDARTGLDASAQMTIPLQRTSSGGPLRPVESAETRQVAPALETSDNRRPRRLLLMAGGTLLIFVLGLLVVTGVEWAKGSPLSGGDSGTSVSRVLDRSATTSSDTEQDTGTTGSTETTKAPSSAEPSAEATPTRSPQSTSPNPARSTGTPAPSAELVPPGGSGSSGSSAEPGTEGQGGLQAPATPAPAPLVGSDS
ncbi:hypothetical protein ACVGVM_25610 [Pseudonocardia bannensis]|uniref:Uncharacterized protein n=1 Tax=Pseudonocardia bannensis TaxID=630973 RepID=A0A848DR50_9PSEU|nr:hypothetical protein [Pseudonocardia bannensis]NMH94774.1 hypothetical protein [Pseudonocardia bannensis]